VDTKRKLYRQILFTGLLLTVSCSTFDRRNGDTDTEQENRSASSDEGDRSPAASPQDVSSSQSSSPPSFSSPDDAQSLLLQLNKRLDTLEAQIASMNDKLDANRFALDKLTTPKNDKKNQTSADSNDQSAPDAKDLSKNSNNSKTTLAPIINHPADSAGDLVSAPISSKDPEAGFTTDEPIQTFRKAMILFQGQKYPEAVLAFSSFLEKYPDHPLAGSSQYYVGEAYMKQKEYKLAIQEFQRVLTSYDRSAHVADTLNKMAIAEENLKNHQEAAKHRQVLSSLFPQSPAASTLQQSGRNPLNQSLSDPLPLKEKPTPLNEGDSLSREPSSHESLSQESLPNESLSPVKIPPTAPIIETQEIQAQPHT
jgi:tol-pal system protein YbgF